MNKQQQLNVLVSSETNEWYTPPKVLDVVREFYNGTIDLDPASCALANEIVMADAYYSIANDGLTKPWFGNVFCNPPYGVAKGESLQGVWADKALREVKVGNAHQVILLTKAVPGYKWWDKLFNEIRLPVCITSECLKFISPAGKHGKSKTASCLWYIGRIGMWHDELFESVFSKLGRVVLP